MNDPKGHLTRDLKVLRYLDALETGDLEAVAVLWDEASRDPELERTLAELDGALFAESASSARNTGAIRAAGPGSKPVPTTRRRWVVWAGVGGTLAAASVLAVLIGPGRDSQREKSTVRMGDSAQPVVSRASDDLASMPAWPAVRRVVDGAETGPFHWPLPASSPGVLWTAIPPDLLE